MPRKKFLFYQKKAGNLLTVADISDIWLFAGFYSVPEKEDEVLVLKEIPTAAVHLRQILVIIRRRQQMLIR